MITITIIISASYSFSQSLFLTLEESSSQSKPHEGHTDDTGSFLQCLQPSGQQEVLWTVSFSRSPPSVSRETFRRKHCFWEVLSCACNKKEVMQQKHSEALVQTKQTEGLQTFCARFLFAPHHDRIQSVLQLVPPNTHSFESATLCLWMFCSFTSTVAAPCTNPSPQDSATEETSLPFWSLNSRAVLAAQCLCSLVGHSPHIPVEHFEMRLI